jgi:hypothetical protein
MTPRPGAQDPVRFQIALEARQYERPTVADFFKHLAANWEVVVDHRELDLVLLLLDFEHHARRLFGIEAIVLRMECIGQPT